MSTISNESTNAVPAAPAIDWAAHTLTIEAPDHGWGCGDVSCCGPAPRQGWCACGEWAITGSDTDYIAEEHLDHVAQAHGVASEILDEDDAVIAYN
jgi:hypothetical protein